MELKFDRQVCSRCGGTGRYSYNQMTGSTCFKCEGKREVLTAKGIKQRNYFLSKVEVKASEIKVGDRISTSAGKFNVLEIKHYPKELKMSGWKDSTGEYVWEDRIGLQGKTMGLHCNPEHKVTRVLPIDQHRALLIEAINSVK